MFYIKHIKTGNNPPENLAGIIGAVRWCYQGEQVGGGGYIIIPRACGVNSYTREAWHV